MAHSPVCHDSFISVPLLIHMCVMAHSYMCHDSCTCVPWLVHICAMTHMCAMAHSFVCHDPFACVPWLIHMCALTHSYVCHDWFTCVPWLIHMSAMCLPNTAPRSKHTTTCVHTSPWCAWKVKECIMIVCARHRTLCNASIGPFYSCPPICVCIVLHMYIHPHPCSLSPPTSKAHTKEVLICMQTKQKRLKQNVPRSLHTCLDTSHNGMFEG